MNTKQKAWIVIALIAMTFMAYFAMTFEGIVIDWLVIGSCLALILLALVKVCRKN